MVSIFDVAKRIVNKKIVIEQWALMEICYYVQAWHYTWTGERLIKEDFQAWSKGAVCPELYVWLLQKPIWISNRDFADMHDDVKWRRGERGSIDIVVKGYRQLDSKALRDKVRSERPWQVARGNLPPNAESTVVITLESMGEYYSGLIGECSNG